MTETAPRSDGRGMAAGPAALLDRWADALSGPRRHAAIGLSLAAYGVIWTLYRLISTLPRDIHFDMSELYAWSRTLALGYEKHPPLSALIVRIWFSIFPVEDWSFTLLAVCNIVLTLYIAWLILERWTGPAKSAFGLALLMLVPFYNFQSLKYNANTVLLPVWALTLYAFLRAFETRSAWWSVLAGSAAAAAMLGKYWSIFLVVGLVMAALIDRRKRVFFLSPAPYLMVLAGGVVLAPHIHWMLSASGETLGYAARRLDGEPTLLPTFTYFAGTVGYALPSLAVWAILLRPNLRAAHDVADPADPQRTLALLCLVLPNILPLLAAPWLPALTPLWALPGYSLLPLVLLATPLITVDRQALRRIIATVALISSGALMASPIVALAVHTRAEVRPTDYGSLLAQDVAARWAANTSTRLRFIYGCGGDADPAQAVAFDLKLRTRTLFGRQGMGARADLLSRGGIIVAAADNEDCSQQGETLRVMRPATQRLFKTYQPTLFGIVGKPFAYVAYIVPPP